MRALYWKGLLVLAGVSSVVYAVNNSYIGFYGPYQVTQYAVGVDPPWEPATAVGPYWVHAFENGNLYTAVWNNNGGGWTVSNGLVGSGTEGILSVGDGFLAYDAYRTRYVIVGTDFDLYRSSAYFGASTDGIT